MKLLILFLIWLLFPIIKCLLLQNIIFPDMVKTCGMLSLTVKVLTVLHGMYFLKNVKNVYWLNISAIIGWKDSIYDNAVAFFFVLKIVITHFY